MWSHLISKPKEETERNVFKILWTAKCGFASRDNVDDCIMWSLKDANRSETENYQVMALILVRAYDTQC